MGRTLVIAEPGCTHEGSLVQLLLLLHAAAEAGADVYKPQWCSNPALMCERRHIGVDHPQRAYYERAYGWLAFQVDWHATLRDRCHELGMKYACSVYVPEDVATIAPFVDYLKISSFEAQDRVLLSACFETGLKTIVSTGIANGPDTTHLFTLRVESGDDWEILACTSAYPAPLDQMNIYVIEAEALDGLSDHSRNLVAGAVAVACGAEVIETHVRLDDCDPANPDYAVSFTPTEFRQYIQNIRDAELMLGSGVKEVQPCEAAMLPYRVVS